MSDSSRYATLLDELKALCPMRMQELSVKQHEIGIWTACDIDPLLDAMEQKPDNDPDILDERMPYWAELWPSATVLAETILNRRIHHPQGKWIELGCGPGLPGIAAAMTGLPGIMTDYLPEALKLAELNTLENQMDQISFRHLDWREPPNQLKVSWILASDVAYEHRNFQPLLDCFDQLLLPDGEIWFSEPGRSVSTPFFDEAHSAGWKRKVLHKDPPVTVHRFFR